MFHATDALTRSPIALQVKCTHLARLAAVTNSSVSRLRHRVWSPRNPPLPLRQISLWRESRDEEQSETSSLVWDKWRLPSPMVGGVVTGGGAHRSMSLRHSPRPHPPQKSAPHGAIPFRHSPPVP